MYQHFFKRIIDFLLASFIFIVLLPVFLVVGGVLLFTNNGQPFFLHPRPGKNGKVFKVIKFKSMNDKKDEHGAFLPFHLRVTKFGNFIRKYSLDEIPQLLNVLTGNMSLIGPRPLLVQYLSHYSEEQAKRHLVKPGITGWAQVNGRNAISWKKKFELDVWYVHNISFILDMKILFLTLKKVLIREGVNANENLNMSTFTGSD